jgi:hypothetical protein
MSGLITFLFGNDNIQYKEYNRLGYGAQDVYLLEKKEYIFTRFFRWLTYKSTYMYNGPCRFGYGAEDVYLLEKKNNPSLQNFVLYFYLNYNANNVHDLFLFHGGSK